MAENSNTQGHIQFKIFDKYDVSKLLIKSHGRRNFENLGATKVNVIERLANRLAVPGHVGKKHKIITSWSSGKYNRNMKTVVEVLALIEQKTKQNPVQVFVLFSVQLK